MRLTEYFFTYGGALVLVFFSSGCNACSDISPHPGTTETALERDARVDREIIRLGNCNPLLSNADWHENIDALVGMSSQEAVRTFISRMDARLAREEHTEVEVIGNRLRVRASFSELIDKERQATVRRLPGTFAYARADAIFSEGVERYRASMNAQVRREQVAAVNRGLE